MSGTLFLTIASQPIGDSTPEDWIAVQMAEWEQCTATEPTTVDGATGLIGGQGCDLAVVTTDGRGYWISLRASDDDPSVVAPYDRAWFESVLATVQLRPDDAVDVASSAALADRPATTAARVHQCAAGDTGDRRRRSPSAA